LAIKKWLIELTGGQTLPPEYVFEEDGKLQREPLNLWDC